MVNKENPIEIFKKIQDYETEYNINIKLPKIVVIGSQSCGKSSVLEKIINRDIIPKGYELTTQCPLIINLRRTYSEEYCEVNNHKELKLEDVKKVIRLEMKKICGSNKNIKDNEIIINLYLKDTIEISLVDLPGLTKIPIEDQPKDIEFQIENLALKYISNENVIILAISAANVDLANSDSLRLSRKVDMMGTRTIGVITKIDMMDSMTNCLDILQNKKSKLKLGYIGIVNRSQKDLNENLSLADSCKKEDVFFAHHNEYKILYPRIGTKYLIETLNNHFSRFLIVELPKVKRNLEEKVVSLKNELKKYDHESIKKIDLIKKYTRTIKNVIKDKHIEESVFIYKPEKKFLIEFNEVFNTIPLKDDFILDEITKKEIKLNNTLFVSEKIFRKIVLKRIEKLEENIYKSFENSRALMIDHVRKINSEIFTDLAEKMASDIEKEMDYRLNILKSNYKEYSEVQKSFVNLNHPDFNKVEIMKRLYQKYIHEKKLQNQSKKDLGVFTGFFTRSTKTENEQYFILHENFEVDLIKTFSDAYFLISRKALVDHALKSTYFYLIKFLENDTQNLLLEKASGYKQRLFEKCDNVQIKINEIRSELTRYNDILSLFN